MCARVCVEVILHVSTNTLGVVCTVYLDTYMCIGGADIIKRV